MFNRGIAAIVALLLLLAVAALWLDRKTETPIASAMQKSETAVDASAGVIYATSFPDADGRQQSLGQWQQKILVINFWATWCAPCKEEMPVLSKLQSEFLGSGVQFVGIGADSSLNVANYSKNTPVSYPLLADEARAIEFSKRLGNRLGLLPYTLLLDRGGTIVLTKLGVVSEHELRDILAKLSKKH